MSDLMPVRHLAPPPRRVPLALSIRVVLGGMLGQLGWFLVGFGFIFVWAFDASGGVMSAIRFSRELATVEGTTTSWRELNLSINDEQVYETSYSFEVGGQTFEGVSYATGYYESEGQRLPRRVPRLRSHDLAPPGYARERGGTHDRVRVLDPAHRARLRSFWADLRSARAAAASRGPARPGDAQVRRADQRAGQQSACAASQVRVHRGGRRDVLGLRRHPPCERTHGRRAGAPRLRSQASAVGHGLFSYFYR